MTLEAQTFVDAHLGAVLAQFPDAVREALRDQFVASWLEPMTSELELVLRKRLTDDEVRHLLFAPTPTQYHHYATLLSLPSAETTAPAPWLPRLHKRFLALFCLKHAQTWSLVVEFCAQDGLQILCDLLGNTDAQVRAQAVDAFVQITSHAAFDWFDAPVGHQAQLLHAKLLALAAPGAGLLPRLIENAESYGLQRDRQAIEHDNEAATEIPRGATLVLLQLLAFFLSWLRKLHARDHKLRLSRGLLELLRDWPTRTRTPLDDEIELAQRVYDDFSRWPPLENATIHGGQAEAEAKAEAEAGQAVMVDVDVRTSPASASRAVFSRAAAMALIADAAATDDALDECIAACSDAVAADVATVDARVSRAQLWLAKAKRSVPPADHEVHAALADCDAVLAADPSNMDAWRCRLELLASRGLWAEAVEAVDAVLDQQDGEGRKASLLPEHVRFLEQERAELQRRAQEAETQDAGRRRALASRQAKMEAIAQRLLQRNASGSAPRATDNQTETADPSPSSESSYKGSPSQDVRAAPSAKDPLARFRAAPWRQRQQDHGVPRTSTPESVAVEAAMQARTFVRRAVRRRASRQQLEELVLKLTPARDVLAALESSLPDDLVLAVLETLVAARPSKREGDRQRRELLRSLLALPRLALLRDMADADIQRDLDRTIAAGKALVLDLGGSELAGDEASSLSGEATAA
ncbi:hypothetical protein P43SY_007659 [Pythium insidiosum]|uniref:Uncharacterized protein n=1 Tax=Pythium insidiosum TaxID=114742 RepID=A0AAD5LNR4_PYTIN|nr:hypothetical protein P43SY_007659 [Pythium insidiosum]